MRCVVVRKHYCYYQLIVTVGFGISTNLRLKMYYQKAYIAFIVTLVRSASMVTLRIIRWRPCHIFVLFNFYVNRCSINLLYILG